ncbi:hypothetical protein [Xanthomonas maliensis]|uniref:hypothetical protein n=1 Tax=Xanthomonas maliensis TaxID=1321368 RepID=UPI00039C93E1|nr:hypothetical protein [Xanthomonas maliensis]KAB7772002.1 hypothetical protein CKY51_01840 [Xanthomonas maliensis]
MRPQLEFVLLSALAGGVTVTLSTVIDLNGQRAPWSDSLKWLLPALFGAALGAWWSERWQRRRAAQAPVRQAGGMAVRTVVLSALGYLLAVAVYLLVALLASGHGQMLRPEVVLLLLVFGCVPLLWAAAPFSVIEYFLCRRYLRRARVLAGSP